MIIPMASFLISFSFTYIVLKLETFHSKYTGDHNLSSPQKMHEKPVPRIGGICIFLGLCISFFLELTYRNINTNSQFNLILILVSATIFIAGFLEDILKNISPNKRLFFSTLSAITAVYLLDLRIDNIEITFFNILLSVKIISIIFTIFSIVGLTNAFNIIDGFNGLASLIAISSLISIAIICQQNGDILLRDTSLIIIFSILGFLIFNFPKGLIFLGDGGAYLLGFLISIISICMINRNENISPWYVFLVNLYPIFETVFTIYRRLIWKKQNPGLPDGIHIHTLIFKRISTANLLRIKNLIPINTNALTSVISLMLGLIAIIPASLFWYSSSMVGTRLRNWAGMIWSVSILSRTT